jgi:hypothetical protein
MTTQAGFQKVAEAVTTAWQSLTERERQCITIGHEAGWNAHDAFAALTPPDPTDPTDLRVSSFHRVSHIDFGEDDAEWARPVWVDPNNLSQIGRLYDLYVEVAKENEGSTMNLVDSLREAVDRLSREQSGAER